MGGEVKGKTAAEVLECERGTWASRRSSNETCWTSFGPPP